MPVAFMGGIVGPVLLPVRHHGRVAVLVSLFVSASRSTRCCRRAGTTRDVEDHRRPGRRPRAASVSTLVRRLRRALPARDRLGAAPSLGRLAIAVVAFVGAFPLLGILGGGFMPDFDRGRVPGVVQGDAGLSSARLHGERRCEMVRELQALPDVDYTYTTHRRPAQNRPVNEGTIYVKLKPAAAAASSSFEAASARMLEQCPASTLGVHQMRRASAAQKPSRSACAGPTDSSRSSTRSREGSRTRCAQFRGWSRSSPASRGRKPELRVDVNRERASDRRESSGEIGTTLQAGSRAKWPRTSRTQRATTRRARAAGARQRAIRETDLLLLSVATGKDDAARQPVMMPLARSRASCRRGPSEIRRRDLVREVHVSANYQGRPLAEVSSDIDAARRSSTCPRATISTSAASSRGLGRDASATCSRRCCWRSSSSI